MFPHLGELIMIGVIILLILGLGRLPQISDHLARGASPDPGPRSDPKA